VSESYGATAVGRDIAVVNVHHDGRFDEGVIEIFVRGIKRVIDLERSGSFGEVAVDVHVTVEKSGSARAAVTVNAVAATVGKASTPDPESKNATPSTPSGPQHAACTSPFSPSTPGVVSTPLIHNRTANIF
jgi:hypothetical protein